MRTEKEMFDLILGVAQQDERIRAVYMNGSRTNPNATKDIFQDFDIVYVVKETESFIQDNDWIKVFGNLIIMQEPDKLDKMCGKEIDFGHGYTYLMQFADGNRIDLHIHTKEKMLEEYGTDKLTVPLLDKDNCLPKIQPSTDIDYWVKKPTQELFYRCCNEFWWVSLYIAKGIWREEIPYAMDSWNFWVRPQLVDMLSWYAGISTDFSCSVGKSGKYLNKYLPDDMWRKFLKTYPKANIVSMWESVFIMCELFQEVSAFTAKEFGFSFNYDEAEKSFAFIKHIKNLPRDAKEIY